ncbi:MAG: hypothetical protein Q8P28_04775 [Deltaproteobacteria bacterium]|nr:hypothetical protein [Deltaproteobacteria bacterium]
MQRALPIILILLLFPVHASIISKVTEGKKLLPKGEDTSYVLPSPILKIMALEFDGLASDYAFLQGLVFFGSTFERKERPRLKEWEWRWFYNILNASTDLDPYFLDPYYVAQAHLIWEGNMVRETNTLLEKGSRYRDWDWNIPFYIGFNHFYFLQNNEEGAVYLMEASKRSGSPSLLPQLAARLMYKANRTENAIIFLQEMLLRTDDENTKKMYGMRLNALKAILFLERAASVYEDRFKTRPETLNDLLAKNIIKEIPKDPYGGKFYIDKDGSIKTTSELR